MERKLSLWQKIVAYKLNNNVYVLVLLFVSVILSFLIYASPLASYKFVPEISIAIATSLLATIFSIVADMYVKFRTYENDQLLEGIHEFGIGDLHFNKQQLLENLLSSCDKEVWVSGYRLILTTKISSSLAQALKQGAKMKILISPPWKEGFRIVYGEHEKVIDNYCHVLNAIAKAAKDLNVSAESICEVRFTNKPLFNDTYKVDMHLITGSFLHNKDEEHKHITANDFFTYSLIRKSRLYHLIENEYLTLWNEADQQLQWEKYVHIAEQIRVSDLRESEKIQLMLQACTSANDVSEQKRDSSDEKIIVAL